LTREGRAEAPKIVAAKIMIPNRILFSKLLFLKLRIAVVIPKAMIRRKEIIVRINVV